VQQILPDVRDEPAEWKFGQKASGRRIAAASLQRPGFGHVRDGHRRRMIRRCSAGLIS
jgi:hypothetical protein